ncbi:MAG: DUF2335 domain-containing protein [Sphingomicrobium sp.]
MNENQPKKSNSRKRNRTVKSVEDKLPSKKEDLPATTREDPASDEQAELERIAELLPPEQKQQLSVRFASHQGWLPPPAMLREYNDILPGLAERIVAMPEREQGHRHQYMDSESKRQFKIRRRGQDYALLGMALVFGFAVFLALNEQPVWAAKLVMVTLVSVVGIFVTGKWLDLKAASVGEHEDD